MSSTRIAITGLGAVSPLGEGMAALADGALAGRSGIAPARQFAGTVFEERVAGAIDRPPGLERRADAANEFARRACLEALADANVGVEVGLGDAKVGLADAKVGLGDAKVGVAEGRRVALVLGSTIAPRDRNVDVIASVLARSIGLGGALVVVVETACTSGSAAVALGATLLRAGFADVALAGGADELDLKSFAGFAALGLLASGACTPFGPLVGTTLGEGAAFFVLEREPDALARGARLRAIVEGDGSSADAFHPTSPHPSGDGLLRAMASALADAGCAPDAIDLVSAHGTGTRANDAAEVAAIHALFGERGAAIPVTATKSQLGHGLGAAGALELAVALAAMERGVVPPTLGLGAADSDRRPGCDVSASETPRPATIQRVLKLGAAFGGANAALVVATPDAARAHDRHRPSSARKRRRIYVAAMGGFGGADAAVDPMGTLGDFDAPAPACDVERLAPGANPRGLDGVSRALVIAVSRAVDALAAARAARGEPPLDLDRTGLHVGQRRASPKSVAEFDDAVEARGYLHVPGGPFTRRVLNTATGAASRARALRGPTLTISTGRGSGLAALALAAEHLASRDDADHLVVASVDEGGGEDHAVGDGAAAIILSAEPSAGAVELVAWRVEPPRGEGPKVSAPSVAGLLTVGRAIAALREGRSTSESVEERGALVTARVLLGLVSLVAWLALTGCQHVMWYGQDPSRAVPVRVLSRCGEQFVVADGAEHRSFDAIGLETLSIARGGRVAYAAEDDGAWWVVVDGHVVPAPFERVALMQWSARPGTLVSVVGDGEGDHLLAVTREDRVARWALGPGFAAIAKGSLVTRAAGAFAFVGFDAAGAHVARGELGARPTGRAFETGPGFDGIASLTIADDGAPSYIARRLNDVFVVRRGALSGPYEDVAALDVSPDGARAVALVRADEAWHADDGAWASEGYDRIGDVRIAAGTRAVALRAKRGEEEFVVMDGPNGEATFGPYRAVVPGTLAIGGPDDRVAFAVTDDAGARVVDRGVPGPPYASVDAITIAADGRLGVIVRDGETALVFVDGEPLGAWQTASDLHLTPKGSVFVAHAKGRDAVVENGEARWFDQIMSGTLAFGADGATWGAVAVVPEGLTLARASGVGPPIDLEAYFGEMIRTGVVDWEPALLRRWVTETIDSSH